MKTLEALAEEARQLAGFQRPASAAETEVARQLQICNACRYCEGFCAVFPAMTRRLEFGPADVHYLANLCHNCGACYHACQYAPPHEFAVNVPQAMARVRRETYTDFAWPPAFGALYRRNGLTLALALAAGLALAWALVFSGVAPADPGARGFYTWLPHRLMASVFGAALAFACLALGLGVRRFWQQLAPGAAGAPAWREATGSALSLKYLDGGHGQGCNEADDRFTLARRRAHHLTFYGFMLCFASTSVATLYHYGFGWHAPYALFSLPVVLGSAGGLALLLGCTGLMALNLKRDPARSDAAQKPMDRGFIALLWLTALSGLALLLGREGEWLPGLLAWHLGTVLAFFLTMPYGKFAHGVYRCAALLKFAIEKRQPLQLKLGDD